MSDYSINKGRKFGIITSNGATTNYTSDNVLLETEDTLEVIAKNYKAIYYKYNVIELVIEEIDNG